MESYTTPLSGLGNIYVSMITEQYLIGNIIGNILVMLACFFFFYGVNSLVDAIKLTLNEKEK
jgi:hypothetical protein